MTVFPVPGGAIRRMKRFSLSNIRYIISSWLGRNEVKWEGNPTWEGKRGE
jgi:hypothetical protein